MNMRSLGEHIARMGLEDGHVFRSVDSVLTDEVMYALPVDGLAEAVIPVVAAAWGRRNSTALDRVAETLWRILTIEVETTSDVGKLALLAELTATGPLAVRQSVDELVSLVADADPRDWARLCVVLAERLAPVDNPDLRDAVLEKIECIPEDDFQEGLYRLQQEVLAGRIARLRPGWFWQRAMALHVDRGARREFLDWARIADEESAEA